MKKSSRIALIGGALSLLVAPMAAADDGFEIGGFGGIHLFSQNNELGIFDDPDADSLKNAFTFGVRLGYNVLKHFGAEGELAIAQTKSRDSDVAATAFGWRLNGLVYFMPGAFRPFALLGVGGSTVSSENPAIVRNETDFVFHSGLGAKYDVDSNWGIRCDARWLLPPSSEGDFVTNDFEFLLGVYKTFGEAPKPAPAPPADTDGDGITDDQDQCPNEPEDVDGIADGDGCPDEDPPPPPGDTDGDGITDDKDKCADKPEDFDKFEDDDGCPDADNDGDRIADSIDRCPNDAETKNGYLDEDGCPDTVPDKIKKFTGAIEGIRFKTGSAIIALSSRPVLDKAAAVLKEFADLRLEISGHTDNQGSEAFNTDLSRRRAEAVRAYLVRKGVAAGRLQAAGYGPTKPIDNNATPAGRAKNRRVEFKLLQN